MRYDWSRCQIDPFILVVLNWCRCQIFLQSLSLPAGVRLTRHQNHVSPIFPPPPPFPSPPPTSWSSCSSCPSHCWRGRSGSTFPSLCRLTSGAILPTTLILVITENLHNCSTATGCLRSPEQFCILSYWT